jgi:amino acid transporter
VTILTVLSSWQLRKTQPDLPRPFRIPWGRTGLLYVIVAPLAMSVVALVASDPFARHWGPVTVLLGPVMYFVLRKLQAGKIGAGQLPT